jgi:hypothetical protein
MTPNNALQSLPEAVRNLIASSIFAEFATVSGAGVPIDTPTFSFYDAARNSFDIATGLAYPAKAERARRNPKVGFLLEGGPADPVVAMAAHGAVCDASIQANLNRYVAETAAYFHAYSQGNPWSVARNTVWYWARIFVNSMPLKIWWWDNPLQMDQAPQRWVAPAQLTLPVSDPAPNAPATKVPQWPTKPWRERVAEALPLGLPHLTVLSEDGYPMPLRARSVEATSDGFVLTMPRGAPWDLQGAASLCFLGTVTFIGRAVVDGQRTRFLVERVLPTLPTVGDYTQLWKPSSFNNAAFGQRLQQELDRRGLPMPLVPLEMLTPTHGSMLRAARMARLYEESTAREQSGKS